MIGRTISQYQIVEKLGEGGMGVVYKAQDTLLKRPVALKLLPRNMLGDEAQRERFLREARAAAALDHPNICTVYEVGEEQGEAFLAMAYVDGQTLRDAAQRGPLPVEEAVELALQSLAGLEEAHDKGVVHRDIKSSNIMVSHRGQAIIVDFGLAQLPDSARVTVTGTAGTAAYMSPEQALGGAVDHRTDLWSLGVVLYEMLTGELPFVGDYPPAVLYAIAHEEPRPVTGLAGNDREALERILKKALAKSPDERYQRAAEMAVELREFLQAHRSGSLAATAAGAATRQERPFAQPGAAAPAATRPAVPVRSPRVWLAFAFAVIFVGLVTWRVFTLPPGSVPAADSASIAVLPLDNLSGDPSQEFFADGMTEALITQLAKIKALRVTSRTSVMHYKDAPKPLPEIARELGVDYAVEGSVLRSGERVRVTAQLVDARRDEHLWAETYDRPVTDVLTLQSQVARAVAGEISIQLTPQDRRRLERRETVDAREFDLCLRGRHYWHQRTAPSLARAIETFQQALVLNPRCADAHTGLAKSYFFQGVFGGLRPLEVMPKAKEAAITALAIDDELAEAHVTLAAIRGLYEWDWPGARQGFERALELNPGSADTHLSYAQAYLLPMGLFAEALAEVRLSAELDPFSTQVQAFLGRALTLRGDYVRAVEQYDEVLQYEPGFYLAYWGKGMALAAQGRFEAARAAFEKADELVPGHPFPVAGLAYLHALEGNRTLALKTLASGEQHSGTRYVSPVWTALAHAVLEDEDEAFRLLHQAVEERDPLVTMLAVFPEFAKLRSDPRFLEILRTLNLAS